MLSPMILLFSLRICTEGKICIVKASDLLLRRKWTFKAHGKQVVFVKGAKEHSSHVLMKALLWALY